MQETWLRAAQTRPVAPIANSRAYLYRVADHVAADHLRQDRMRARLVTDEAIPDTLCDPAPDPEQVAATRQELALLEAAIRDLPAKCRAVFLLYRGRGFSMREIAATMGISEKTVEKHIAKAMVHCRQRLSDAGVRRPLAAHRHSP
jgi:RNA polymerase sigma-70 factor (ECF subfamily)